jgi:hypothetical protein
MTLFEFEELASYWAEHPPLHLLVGAYLGVGKNNHNRVSASTAPVWGTGSAFGSVLSQLGPGFGAGDVHAGLAPVVLDIAELRRRAKASD